jgi:hypothetical protein
VAAANNGGPAVEILRNIDIEIAAFCLAGLVLVQLALELRRLYLDPQETPPRLIRLKRRSEKAEARESEPAAAVSAADDLSGDRTVRTRSAAKRWV